MSAKKITIANNEVFTEKNILNDLFTKCNSCSLRRTCTKLSTKTTTIKKKIDVKSKTIDKHINAVNNDVDRFKKSKDALIKYEKKLWKQFDISLTNIECEYERTDIIEDLKMLQSKYNFSDARIFLIVKQHLRQSILDFRTFKETARHKLITYRMTEDGSRIPMVSPLLNYKLQSGNFIVKLIETLDKITKEDAILDGMQTSGSDFFKKYLSNLSDGTEKIIDVSQKSAVKSK